MLLCRWSETQAAALKSLGVGLRMNCEHRQRRKKNYSPAELRPPNMKMGYALPMIASTSQLHKTFCCLHVPSTN